METSTRHANLGKLVNWRFGVSLSNFTFILSIVPMFCVKCRPRCSASNCRDKNGFLHDQNNTCTLERIRPALTEIVLFLDIIGYVIFFVIENMD